MKRFLMIPLFALLCSGAQAALYINNNTTCTFQAFVVAFDINTPGCVMHTNPMTIGPNDSYAYNNVTSLNVSPGWGGGYMATNAGGPTAWGWSAFLFNFMGSSVGGTIGSASCATTMTVTVPNVCVGSGNIIVSWTPGANTFIEFN